MIVTVFTIILFSIIILAFTRLILSEVSQTTNSNLSKSAYDSALAGVEDAKVALLKYHDCLNKGYTVNSGNSCSKIIAAMQDGVRRQDCSTVSNVLGRTIDEQHGVTIQEVKDSSQDGGSAVSKLQAYTCVTIQEDLADYRSTLSSDTRTRIVPLRTDQIQNLRYINIKWFSDTNYTTQQRSGSAISWDQNDGLLPSGQHSMSPPLISAAFFQSDRNFNLGEFNIASSENSTNRVTTSLLLRSLKPSIRMVITYLPLIAKREASSVPLPLRFPILIEVVLTVILLPLFSSSLSHMALLKPTSLFLFMIPSDNQSTLLAFKLALTPLVAPTIFIDGSKVALNLLTPISHIRNLLFSLMMTRIAKPENLSIPPSTAGPLLMVLWTNVRIITKVQAIVGSNYKKVAVLYLLFFYVKYQKRALLLSYNL